jgi:hypothetical protein
LALSKRGQATTGKEAQNNAKSKSLQTQVSDTLSLISLEFDHQKFQQQFEADCKNIVDEIQEKFIDLGVENHSAYGTDIIARQERLKKEMDKLHFDFKTNCLDLPAA